MVRKTNLRALRIHHEISLMELEAVSGLSNQYISRAELGEISPTSLLEEKLDAAIETIIAQRSARLVALEQSFAVCKGRLLQLEGGKPGE